MPSSATTRNRLEKQAAGENSNSWGTRLNTNVIDLVDAALDGMTSFTLSGSKTLTSNDYSADEARTRYLNVTGGTGGTITIPNLEKLYLVRNGSSGDVVISTGSGTTATIKSGNIQWVACEAGNVVRAALVTNFGSANLSTTGTLASGNLTVTGNVGSTSSRATGTSGFTTGAGVETFYNTSTTTGYIAAYDRDAATSRALRLQGSSVSIRGNGDVGIADFTTTGLAVTGTLSATGNITTTGTSIGMGANPANKVKVYDNGTDYVGMGVDLSGNANELSLFGWTGAAPGSRVAMGLYDRTTFTTIGAFTSTGLAVTGTLSCTGNATLGDASTDTHTVNGDIAFANGRIGSATNYMLVATNSADTVIGFEITDTGKPHFNSISTTASAANAYLDSGTFNELRRSTSSLRYKTGVEDVEPQYAEASLSLRPVYYRSLAEADPDEYSYWGYIAEEVAEIDPRLVHWSYLDSDYETVEIAPAVEAKDAVLGEDGEVLEPAVAALPAQTERRLKKGAVKVPDGVQYERIPVLQIAALKARIEALEAALANTGPF